MSYSVPPGDTVALPLAFDYAPPAGDAVALPMPDGFIEITGTARFGDTVAAALVVAYDLQGLEIDRTVPAAGGNPIGQYTIVAERGPMLMVAHAFDPLDWLGIWAPGTAYQVGNVVFGDGDTTSESVAIRCVSAGTSGANEPAWELQVGATTADGGASWETLGRVRDVAPVTNFHVAE